MATRHLEADIIFILMKNSKGRYQIMAGIRYLVSVMLICLLSGCMRDSVSNFNQASEQENTETVTEDVFETGDTADMTFDISELLGDSIPLEHTYVELVYEDVPGLVIEDYVVEDENEFTEWDEEFIRQMKRKCEQYPQMSGFEIVEIHNEAGSYKAMRIDDSVYVVEVGFEFEIWKEGKKIIMKNDSGMSFTLGGSATDIWFYDVEGKGTPQLIIWALAGGSGEARCNTWIFDMEDWKFMEVENSDEYIMDAYRNVAESYIAGNGEIKENCKFYLTDNVWNYISGFRPWKGMDMDRYCQELSVTYMPAKENMTWSQERVGKIYIYYEYNSEKNMMCVTEVKTENLLLE